MIIDCTMTSNNVLISEREREREINYFPYKNYIMRKRERESEDLINCSLSLSSLQG